MTSEYSGARARAVRVMAWRDDDRLWPRTARTSESQADDGSGRDDSGDIVADDAGRDLRLVGVVEGVCAHAVGDN
jgi:hypothetical protein